MHQNEKKTFLFFVLTGIVGFPILSLHTYMYIQHENVHGDMDFTKELQKRSNITIAC